MADYIATSTLNGEAILQKELAELGITESKPARGKVIFRASEEEACRAAYFCRTARKVLMPVRSFRFSSKEDFYEGASSVEWEEMMDISRTFAVRVKGEDAVLRNSAYSALLLKDAIVDRLRDKKGRRPDVDKEKPNTMVQAFLEKGRVSISLDLGGSLHKRGYRAESSPGSLNEALAASILKFCGYSGEEPFLDPMCGSGTIGIEAALIAGDIAPGLLWRYEKGFFSLPFIPADVKRTIPKMAKERVRRPAFSIAVSDIDGRAVRTSMNNAKRAGVAAFMKFREEDFFSLRPEDGGGLMVSNLPYGDHVESGTDLESFYRSVGDKLKRDFMGFRAGLLMGSAELQKSVGLYAFRKVSLYNGSKEVRLCLYELYEGSRKAGKGESRQRFS